MATENQIQANRANAEKSTGPVTPEGKRISSKNASKNAAHRLVSGAVVIKGESIRRFNELAAALTLQFQPRNPAETCLVQTMAAARWRTLRMWGIQSASLEIEMARLDSSLASETHLATAFRRLADNSKNLDLQNRLETCYDRQYNHALSLLLKLQETKPIPPPLSCGSPDKSVT